MFSQNFNINSLELGYGKDRTSSISSGDIDNDGDIDLIIANGRHWPGQNKILLNNGIGRLTVDLSEPKSFFQVLILRHLEEKKLD